MAQLISPPGSDPVDRQDERGKLAEVNQGWRVFFSAVYTICSALTQSGTTAQRPTTMLWTGRTFFDTTLGIPIWYQGATVWIDSSGAPV